MSRFFVGQRVRIVSCLEERNRYTVGMEATVTGMATPWQGQNCVSLDIHPLPDGSYRILAAHLEPILDQRHEACDEDFKRDLARLLERQGVLA